MEFDWILFDADETLFRFDAFLGLTTMFSHMGVNFSPDDYQNYQSVNQALWGDYQQGHIGAEELKHRRFESWAEKLSTTTEILNRAFLDAMAEVSTLLPGAKLLLDALYGQVKLGMITNGFVDLQSQRLEKHGMTHLFDHIVISEEVGTAKPDPAIFSYAYMQMGNPDKSRVLMVGDNIHADIAGGAEFGFTTCWLNAKREPVPDMISVDYEVQTLSELHQILHDMPSVLR